jgi:gas vesicle protein GvpL/GvpF
MPGNGAGGTYVYGVLRAGGKPPAGKPGVEEAPVRVVEYGRLAALASDAPKEPVKANRRNLTAHSNVLQEAIASGCVLPMQFGVVMPDDGVVSRELLERHAGELQRELESFADVVELNVKVFCPEDRLLKAILSERPELAAARERLWGRSEEETYYERIELGEKVSQAVDSARDETLRRLLAELEPLAAATEVDEVKHPEVLADVAFLVDRPALDRFAKAAERVGTALGPERRTTCVGPLPPYDFVELPLETEESWA